MTPIYFDFESRSPNPIRWGIDQYFARAEPLILTWAVGDGPVQLADYTNGSEPRGALPNPEFWFHDHYTYIAHNAQFDRRVLERLFGCHVPMERMRCTQAQAYAHGLPGSLETLGEVLGIQLRKLTGEDGHKLMLFFCTPRSITKAGVPIWNEPRDHPEKWEAFKRYAIRDVEALREIHKKLPTHNYQGVNLDTWFLDQRINERGFGFDSELATAASKVLDAAKVKQRRYTAALTDGGVNSVTQRQKLLDWFNNSGLEIASMKAADIRDALEGDDLDPMHRFLLELRLEGSKSSGAKYRRGLECVGPDGRLRDTMLYSGANRTGRWSGRQYQPHNLPRPSARWEDIDKADPWKPIEAIAVPAVRSGDMATIELHGGPNAICNDITRSAIIAQGRNELVSADWANIESRFLAWCTENHWKLDYFRAVDRGEAADSYKALWARFFGMKAEDVTKKERQAAKQLDLACGYLGGTGALVTMAIGNNVDLEELMVGVLDRVPDEIKRKAKNNWRRAFLEGEDFGLQPWVYQSCDALVRLYRQANDAVVDEGYHIGKVVADAMAKPNTLFRAAKCDIWFNGHALIIQLPSGRRLFYWSPQMREEKEVDTETGEIKVRNVFWYKASRGKQWRWLKGWPGLWIENVCQAGCNDVLRLGMLNVQRYCEEDFRISTWLAGLPRNAQTPLVLHVHDEPTCELPTGMLPYETLEWLLTDDLKAKHSWMAGIPLAASGWRGGRYRK
jgi:DNA polymerase bacteriophage-type